MAKVAVTRKWLEDIADSIRSRGGFSSQYKPSQMASAIMSIPYDSDHDTEDGIIDKSISGSYTNSRVTSVGASAFADCINLANVSFPSCASVGSHAFENCTALASANFPECTDIGSYAFDNSYSLSTMSFPVCEAVGHSAFNNCISLESASFPACSTIGANAFAGCTNMTNASFPVCASIGASAFYKCFTMTSLYLLGSTVATLAASNAFNSTPFMGYVSSTSGVWGSIYVPASLLDSYKIATNWAYYSNRFVGV